MFHHHFLGPKVDPSPGPICISQKNEDIDIAYMDFPPLKMMLSHLNPRINERQML